MASHFGQIVRIMTPEPSGRAPAAGHHVSPGYYFLMTAMGHSRSKRRRQTCAASVNAYGPFHVFDHARFLETSARALGLMLPASEAPTAPASQAASPAITPAVGRTPVMPHPNQRPHLPRHHTSREAPVPYAA
ncbi:MAG TPA: hypothetical protein PK620_08185 [Denitromonas sp.]|nr:hypothetical protein [Denitromonas sp.]HQV14881.1 hypothetical protein [Denitromonas sp.]